MRGRVACSFRTAARGTRPYRQTIMKIMFTVQGDGRGHMTQAIAAAQAFERHGHEIVAVTVGTNPSRTIPEFFAREFDGRLKPIASPGFCFQRGRGVATFATARQALSGLGHY